MLNIQQPRINEVKSVKNNLKLTLLNNYYIVLQKQNIKAILSRHTSIYLSAFTDFR